MDKKFNDQYANLFLYLLEFTDFFQKPLVNQLQVGLSRYSNNLDKCDLKIIQKINLQTLIKLHKYRKRLAY